MKSVVYVNAGQCNKEVVIKIKKLSNSLAEVDVETNCDYINQAKKELRNIKVGEELSLKMCETQVHKVCSKYVCRTSCVVPQAILKAIEVEFEIFSPQNCSIEFIEI